MKPWTPIIGLSLAACGTAEPGFQQIARNTLAPSCATGGCHAAPELKAAAALVLTPSAAWASLVDKPVVAGDWPLKMRGGLVRVKPGDPDASALMLTLTHDPSIPRDLHMPPVKLPEAQIEEIRAWILRGAPND